MISCLVALIYNEYRIDLLNPLFTSQLVNERSEEYMKTKKRAGYCLGGAVVFLLIVGCILIGVGLLGVKEFKDIPRLVTGFSFDQTAPPPVDYSSAQTRMIQEYGYPEGFYILFFQREGIDGDVEEVRYEEWNYYSQKVSVAFENGEQLELSEIPLETVLPTPYQPGSFSAFVTREQVAASAGLDEWLILPVEKELVPDADLYYAEGLTFGLQNGRLVYIETMVVKE